jgi:hypothetical protein
MKFKEKWKNEKNWKRNKEYNLEKIQQSLKAKVEIVLGDT